MNQKTTLKVSAIVPAYNEEKNVGRILDFLLKIKEIDEVICVNDGSTDSTLEKIKQYSRRRKLRIINLEENKGKGNAMAEGVEKARGEIVVFIDADVKNLKRKHILSLIKPLKEGKYDVSLGYPMNNILDVIFVPLAGERAYFRKDLLPLLGAMRKKGYGVEMFLNYHFSNKRVFYFPLDGMIHPYKHEKQGYEDVIKLTLKEIRDILREVFKQRNPVEYFVNAFLYPFYIDEPEVYKKKIKEKLTSLPGFIKAYLKKTVLEPLKVNGEKFYKRG